MIRILYDHQKFSTQRYGGISRYFANLIQAIKTSPDFECQLGVLLSNNHYLEKQDGVLRFINSAIKNPNHIYKINKAYNSYLLDKNDFDLFHPTYYDTYFINKVRKPLVVTIHDMTYERLPEYFWAKDPLTLQKRENVERADKIIAISETTKNDLIKYLNTDPKKIEVVYHGIDFNAPFITRVVENIPKNYILFVGDRSGYKNFFLFINAFKEISNKHTDLNIVLTGGGNLDIAEIEHIKRLDLGSKVTHINVDDEQLNYLYQQALVFVYPSLHEGFGLPILEAFTAKCPIILSDTECFREIAKDAAIFFEPHSVEDLMEALERVISDTALRTQLIEKGTSRLMDFPIGQSVRQTLDVYKQLV